MAEVRTELKQDDALSSILFNLILEKVVREIKIRKDEDIMINDFGISLLAYANDIVLLSEDLYKVVDL